MLRYAQLRPGSCFGFRISGFGFQLTVSVKNYNNFIFSCLRFFSER